MTNVERENLVNHPGDQEVERAREWLMNELGTAGPLGLAYMTLNGERIPQLLAAYASSRDTSLERLQQENALLRAGAPLPTVQVGTTASNSTPIAFQVGDASHKSLVAELVEAIDAILLHCERDPEPETEFQKAQIQVQAVLARAKETM